MRRPDGAGQVGRQGGLDLDGTGPGGLCAQNRRTAGFLGASVAASSLCCAACFPSVAAPKQMRAVAVITAPAACCCWAGEMAEMMHGLSADLGDPAGGGSLAGQSERHFCCCYRLGAGAACLRRVVRVGRDRSPHCEGMNSWRSLLREILRRLVSVCSPCVERRCTRPC